MAESWQETDVCRLTPVVDCLFDLAAALDLGASDRVDNPMASRKSRLVD